MTAEHTIIIVDDDDDMRETTRALLEMDGYAVLEARDAEQLKSILTQGDCSLILLDIVLPGHDGFSILKNIRKTSCIPVILISGKDDVIDKILGLEFGADDYITKPFHGRELIARIKTVMRRFSATKKCHNDKTGQTSNEIRFNGWKMDLFAHTLLNDRGEKVNITTHEFAILKVLVASAGRVLTRDQILDRINKNGRDWAPYDRSLDVMIAKIRKKLGDNPKDPTFIRTIRQSGYMFIAPVDKK